jgi:tetratricopeptide (TPR) repeat protein
MSKTEWLDLLGWSADEMEDIRFVGYSYVKQGKYQEALKFFEALVVLAEGNLYDLQTLGALYLETGNNLSALNYLERALKIDSSHEPTLLNRAKALFLLGYKRQALAQSSQLERSSDALVANQARALTLAYS